MFRQFYKSERNFALPVWSYHSEPYILYIGYTIAKRTTFVNIKMCSFLMAIFEVALSVVVVVLDWIILKVFQILKI